MNEPIAFRNGELIGASQLSVPAHDQGFVQGVTIAEQMRTFGGRIFRLDEHLERMLRCLQVVDVEIAYSKEQLSLALEQLIQHNHGLLREGDDLGLCLFVTPGIYPTFAASSTLQDQDATGPLVGAHTFPLPFSQWAHCYDVGQPLVVSSIRQIPGECWPSELKCRSRMHYYLADLEARKSDPRARALLLDQDGAISEASTASVFAFRLDEGLIAPPVDAVLPGISLKVIEQIAGDLGVPFVRRPMFVPELLECDEVMLCSTSPCILPVTRIDHRPVADGAPGPLFAQILDAWCTLVRWNIAEQALNFAHRSDSSAPVPRAVQS